MRTWCFFCQVVDKRVIYSIFKLTVKNRLNFLIKKMTMTFIKRIKHFPFSTKLKWSFILFVEIVNLYFWFWISKYFNDSSLVLILAISVVLLICSMIHINNRICSNWIKYFAFHWQDLIIWFLYLFFLPNELTIVFEFW